MAINWSVIFLFCGFFVMVLTAKNGSKPKETSGPYITVLHRIVPCKNPAVSYAKETKSFLDVSVKNNIVKGNYTVFGKTSNLQTTLHDFYYIDGKWQTTFVAKNISCRSKWVAILLEFLGVKYEKRSCAVPKGSYIFEVDYNKLDHTWMPVREYGKMMRRIEAHSKAGTIVCCEFESDIIPKINN